MGTGAMHARAPGARRGGRGGPLRLDLAAPPPLPQGRGPQSCDRRVELPLCGALSRSPRKRQEPAGVSPAPAEAPPPRWARLVPRLHLCLESADSRTKTKGASAFPLYERRDFPL